MSRKFSASFRVFRRGGWSCILRVQGNILRENGFVYYFFSFLDTERYFWSILAIKGSGVVKTGFSVSMETFGCNSFAKHTNCYFPEFRAEIVWLAVRKKSAGLSSCFLPLHGNNLKKIFLKSFCIFCGLFFGSFPVIEQEKILPAYQNSILCIYKIIFKKKLFCKTNENFHPFWTGQWAGRFRLLVESFDGDVRTAFYVSRITF